MSSEAGASPAGSAEQGSAATTPASSPAKGLPPSRSASSRSTRGGIAGKIAAFASGVAPVQRTDEVLSDDEQEQTVEELLHRLEAATRGPAAGEGSVVLPLKMVLQVVERFGALSQEAARLDKELEKAKASSSQGLLMPSAWVKREHKYKQDLEMFERKIGWQAERIERLEAELVQQREGDNVRPLEEKINELESRLKATAEEKTQALSKFHELSIKHRQLIETSPHVSAVWREVVVQQSNGKDAAAVNRLTNFDLRHTNGGPMDYSMPSTHSHKPAASVADLAALHGSRGGSSDAAWDAARYSQASLLAQLGGQAATAAVAQSQPAADSPSSTPFAAQAAGRYSGDFSTATAAGPTSNATAGGGAAGGGGPGGGAAAGGATTASMSSSQHPQSAEAQAHALIASIAAEQATPEAAVEALQQLNYDLTMQLGMYQQMVQRLNNAMEESDLAKAELEASSAGLEMQLEQLRAHLQQAGQQMARAGSANARAGSTASKAGWGGWWRGRGSNGRVSREGVAGAAGADSDDEAVSESSLMRDSLATLSVQSSLDGALFATAALDGDGEMPEMLAALSPCAASADREPGAASEALSPRAAAAAAAAAAAGVAPAAAGYSVLPAAATAGSAGAAAAPVDSAAAFAAARAKGKLKRANAATKAAEEREKLAREAKEAWRQAAAMGEENGFLVKNLVEIKTELAEAQGTVLQFKRALLRAMDDKVCMETKVAELRNMLNMATALPGSGTAGSGPESEPSGTPQAGATGNDDGSAALASISTKAAAGEQVQQQGRESISGGSSSSPGTPPSAGRGGAAGVPSSAAVTESLDGHALSDGGELDVGSSDSEGGADEAMQVLSLQAEQAAKQGGAAAQGEDAVEMKSSESSVVSLADLTDQQQQQQQQQVVLES